MIQTVLVSGGFDPLHVGHLRMFEDAARFGKVIVALNSDNWLCEKKNYNFMEWQARKEILEAVEVVHKVIGFDDSDGTAAAAIRQVNPTYFANGGDRGNTNVPTAEIDACNSLDVRMLWQMGGGKVQSSSDLVKRAIFQMEVNENE